MPRLSNPIAATNVYITVIYFHRCHHCITFSWSSSTAATSHRYHYCITFNRPNPTTTTTVLPYFDLHNKRNKPPIAAPEKVQRSGQKRDKGYYLVFFFRMPSPVFLVPPPTAALCQRTHLGGVCRGRLRAAPGGMRGSGWGTPPGWWKWRWHGSLAGWSPTLRGQRGHRTPPLEDRSEIIKRSRK